MKVSIRTLVNLTRNAELQRTVAHVIGPRIDDIDQALTQSDINAIAAEFDRYSTFLSDAALEELDPFSSTLELFEIVEEPLTAVRYEMQCSQDTAIRIFKDLIKMIGLEQPTQWQDL
jgi:hypothetical protein